MTHAEEILVGVDGSPHSKAAVDWAMAEARRRDCGVLLVHVSEIAAGLWTTTPNIRQGLRELARPILDHAVARARSLDPTIKVRGRLILGSPHRALVSMSANCVLTVLGRQGRGAIAAHLVGSLSQSVMAHAHNPVVAVAPDGAGAGRPIERVVVAFGDRPTSMRALEFGISEARLNQAGLRVVHAWQPPRWPHLRGAVEDPESAVPAVRIARESRRISALLAAVAPQCTDLDLNPVVLAGQPVGVLSEFCRPSDLLVLGQHRHGRYLPATLGSVISGALHRTPSTVAVVGEAVLAEEPAATTEVDRAEQPLPSGLIAY
ncbi:MAG: hypothetical protein QOE23_3326 [Pseudonocardiales bacterium]|jgi:nucleotide-binding universal stress UspA family protein|nr:hypothetical protein [Pseudonocardiales bacterium]